MPITRDPERLAHVASQLGAALREGEDSGARVRLPVIPAGDAAGLVMAMHEHLDQVIEERAERAAAEGHHIACSAGCSSCCIAPVLVTEGEAVTVAEWLKLPDNSGVREWFTKMYPAWRSSVGDTLEVVHAARNDHDRRDALVAYKLKAVMCPFNREGLCAIYPARPSLCRKAHALDTNANCGAEGDGKVKYFQHAPTEMTYQEQQPMRAALHHSLRPGAGIELLPAAVHRLLGSVAGRNDPCPCGSGKKYKRCCGA